MRTRKKKKTSQLSDKEQPRKKAFEQKNEGSENTS